MATWAQCCEGPCGMLIGAMPLGVKMGDVPTWIGAIGATVAAGGALWTLASQRNQIDEQRRFIGRQDVVLAHQLTEFQALAEVRRWEQAKQIKRTAKDRPYPMYAASGFDGSSGLAIDVMNGSDAPIYQVAVVGDVESAGVALVRPEGGWEDAPVQTLAPGLTARFFLVPGKMRDAYITQPLVSFDDKSDQRWSLDEYHDLQPVAEN
ncbi:hypothetical protein [Kitasatospora sp. NBC_00070]|uniref:hypothetical protein n=1 Tax=Kitasatospora sp. NBC_00070 TaxID=2975962 RepID=UPI003860110B